MATRIMPVSDLRRDTGKVIRVIQQGGDVVFITQRGRPAAVPVGYEHYEDMLAQLEDLSDLVGQAAAAGEPEREYGEIELPERRTND